MLCRQIFAFSIVALVLGGAPGCCCCVRGFKGPVPQPQPVPQPFPQDGIVVGPKDKLDGIKVDDRKPDDKKVDGIKLVDKLDKDALNKLIDKLNKKDKKDGPPPPVDLEDVSTGGPLVADPLPKPLQPVTDPKGSVMLPKEGKGINNDPCRYPWRTSPIVAVASGGGKKGGAAVWQVWDLQAMKQLGTVPGEAGAGLVLSPDGAYLGIEMRKGIKLTGMQFYTVADGQPLKELRTSFSTDSRAAVVDFVAPGQVYALNTAGANKALVKLWDVKTGEQLASYNTEGIATRNHVATSPGGRFLATFNLISHKIHIYEVQSGKELRTTQVKFPGGQFHNPLALAFSDDGKALAALYETGPTAGRIRAWDFATGKRIADHAFTHSVDNIIRAGAYRQPLVWLPDGSGWFVWGQLMVDRQVGKVFWTMPPQDAKIPWPRRFLDNDHIATVMGVAPQRRMEIVTLPRDEIEAARKK